MNSAEMEPGEKIPVGISQCLLGDKVRYDGEHKRSRFCTDVLAPYFDFEPICPEVAIGLGIPRPPIRLVEDGGEVRVKGVKKADLDPTDDLREYSEKRTSQLDHLCGYILMQNSPSCGMERVAVYHPNGNPLHHQGVGVYAEVLKRNHPLLPIEESGRLNDSTLRENFIARVYAFYRWKKIENNLTPKVLIDFYSDYKYLVMAHDPQAYHSIGQLLADMKADDIHTIGEQFIELLMNTLKIPATRKTNTNVLMHIQGYFKNQLSSDEKQELAQVIDQYRQGIIPMIAPMVLIKHFLKQHPSEYLERQAFLNPYPEALSLRNAI